jgi:type III pantothenate kinase
MNKILLIIGNSRLHWALLNNNNLVESWDTPHLLETINQDFINKYFPKKLDLSPILKQDIPLTIASVVPSQSNLWENYTPLQFITLQDIPIKNLYQTMGIDRALALWGGVTKYGFPCLIIDGGTALTLTGIDEKKQLVGGAILPGLKLQQKALFLHTAALPEINLSSCLPPRWATNTPQSIESGIIYTVLAGLRDFIQDWYRLFPHSLLILTGGDRHYLKINLSRYDEYFKEKMMEDGNLIFWGMKNLNNS